MKKIELKVSSRSNNFRLVGLKIKSIRIQVRPRQNWIKPNSHSLVPRKSISLRACLTTIIVIIIIKKKRF